MTDETLLIDGLNQIGTVWTGEYTICDRCGHMGVELAIQEDDTIKYYHIVCAKEIVRSRKFWQSEA
jgi:hypothetical protein